MIDYKRMADLFVKSLGIKKQGMNFKYDPVGNNNEWDLDFLLKAKLNSQDAAELKDYLAEYFKNMLGYITLRQYIESKCVGAYNHFLFQIDFQRVDVINVEDFERYYQRDLLDKYIVVDAQVQNNGSDSTNYCCDHYLTLEEKGVLWNGNKI